MPTDSGHSFNITNEAEDTLPASQGDTPDLHQGLVTLGILVESADRAITPIPDPITPLPEIEDSPFITDLSDVLAAVGGKGGRTQESPNGQHAPPTGDHEGPPFPTSSTLAPTDGDGLFLRLTPIGRPQGSHLLYTAEMVDLQALPVGAPHSTLLVDAVLKRRLRKIMLRRYSRQQLRAARVRGRRATRKLALTIASTVLA